MYWLIEAKSKHYNKFHNPSIFRIQIKYLIIYK
jgi:hypothetical protein